MVYQNKEIRFEDRKTWKNYVPYLKLVSNVKKKHEE